MAGKKQVWVQPGKVTFDNKARVSWTHDGNHGRGEFNAKVTEKAGARRFRIYRDAVSFGKKQALRMGEGTELGLRGVMAEAKYYIVKDGKFVKARAWY